MVNTEIENIDNKNIMWVSAEFSFDPVLARSKSALEQAGYNVTFMDQVRFSDIKYSNFSGLGLIKQVMRDFNGNVDLLTIDGVIEQNLKVVDELKSAGIYDGKTMIYPTVNHFSGRRKDIETSGADFGTDVFGYNELVKAVDAIFKGEPIPENFCFDTDKYYLEHQKIRATRI